MSNSENQDIANYQKVSNQLQLYIESEQFKGYDPYDTLNSWIPFHWLGKWGGPIAIQIQKRNPINVRPFIGIKKEYNPKALGLLLHAYTIQYQRNATEETKNHIDFLFQWLLNNPSKGFKHYCWGYNFDWASSVKVLKAYSPTIVVSGFIAKAIIEYYQTFHDDKALEVLKSIGNFIREELPISTDHSGICFSYSTIETDCCYNASMLGSELFAFLFSVTKDEVYKKLAVDSTNFVVDKQKADGKWDYSIDLKTGKERTQIDFHQGYVIDSLANVIKYIPESKSEFESTLNKGLQYYRTQFLENGQSYYRVPAKWPVDIHNQAQGIVTFSRLAHLNEDYLTIAQQIADYTIKNIRSSKGYFYYKKYPWIAIKTPFMRWSQAWMFLALAEIIMKIETNNSI